MKLYYDELEIANPLGSKKGIHKLGAFYFAIMNLPAHMNADLNSIHVLAICHDYDAKKYGFDRILARFRYDLDRLESDEGVKTFLDGYGEYTLRATIAAFCGDTAGVHDVLNLLAAAANHFCRVCRITRNELLSNDLKEKELMSEEVYSQLIDVLKNANFSAKAKTQTGLNGECCLNSRYFHLSRNMNFDPMHDIFCSGGVGQ